MPEDLLTRLRVNIPALKELQDAIVIDRVEKPGFVHFTCNVPESLGNYRGGIHGGTAYFIGEIGAGFAAYSLGRENVCQTASINFIKAVPTCLVEVTTETLHAGRSTAVIRVTSRRASDGKLLFESTHTMFLMGELPSE